MVSYAQRNSPLDVTVLFRPGTDSVQTKLVDRMPKFSSFQLPLLSHSDDHPPASFWPAYRSRAGPVPNTGHRQEHPP